MPCPIPGPLYSSFSTRSLYQEYAAAASPYNMQQVNLRMRSPDLFLYSVLHVTVGGNCPSRYLRPSARIVVVACVCCSPDKLYAAERTIFITQDEGIFWGYKGQIIESQKSSLSTAPLSSWRQLEERGEAGTGGYKSGSVLTKPVNVVRVYAVFFNSTGISRDLVLEGSSGRCFAHAFRKEVEIEL
ncbi:hypothetical protein VTL71DRAFT_9445 [Oculimacula yallundae]|uniref:Uncharacterized protein n=1 Tax=Oculimacula yallundae TaxID=86028 RepID=A0ABR4BRZ0_9HELO